MIIIFKWKSFIIKYYKKKGGFIDETNLSLLLGAAMIFSLFGRVTVSAEGTEQLYWDISNVEIDHTSVSFRMSLVSGAQEVMFCIGDKEGEELVRCSFLTKSTDSPYPLYE